MPGLIDSIERAQLRRVPAFQAGDRVRVHFQVVEGNRRRTQVFEGVVIKRQGSGARETFTVRKQSFGVGVERTFPLHSPKIERIEVASRGDVRRAKLYYLRGRVGKRARVRERQYTGEAPVDVVIAPQVAAAAADADVVEAVGAAEAEELQAEAAGGEQEKAVQTAEQGGGDTAPDEEASTEDSRSPGRQRDPDPRRPENEPCRDRCGPAPCNDVAPIRRALELGMVNQVVPRDELEPTVAAIAPSIMKGSWMNRLEAPTRRMIPVSRRRLSAESRIAGRQ